jgi:hypothetical protein
LVFVGWIYCILFLLYIHIWCVWIICDILPFIVHPSLKVSRSFIDFFVVVMACCSSSVYSSAVVVFLITCYKLCFILILNDA